MIGAEEESCARECRSEKGRRARRREAEDRVHRNKQILRREEHQTREEQQRRLKDRHAAKVTCTGRLAKTLEYLVDFDDATSFVAAGIQPTTPSRSPSARHV